MDIPEISETWPKLFAELLGQHTLADAAHDPNHIRRVVTNARRLTLAEGADWLVVMPAAWLHDCVAVPKSSPDRRNASRLCARQAVEWLENHDWPHGRLDEIGHAIEAHSFSAGIAPRTLEAKVVQDADRLDALGAVGLARTLMLGGELQRSFYDDADPFCETRAPDDSIFTLDHLFAKLLTLEGTMQTPGGRVEAGRRTQFIRTFLVQLHDEIGSPEPGLGLPMVSGGSAGQML
jgi:uncharacterized protein